MTAKVVDASAIVALLFNETTREAIVSRLREATMHAPDLLGFEVASACLKKMRAAPRDTDALLQAFYLFSELPIEFDVVDFSEALRLAHEAGLSVYDASYLLLAISLEAELVTLDNKLSRAYETLRISPSA